MDALPAGLRNVEVVVHDDDQTTWDFIVDLLQDVFGKSAAEARSLTAAIDGRGSAVVGRYPPAVAEAIVAAARARVDAAGFPLVLGLRMPGDGVDTVTCAVCGQGIALDTRPLRGARGVVCEPCVAGGQARLRDGVAERGFKLVHQAITAHFAGLPTDRLTTIARKFAAHVRADIQLAVAAMMQDRFVRFLGFDDERDYRTTTFATLLREAPNPARIAPVRYDDIDIGEDEPVRCLHAGLWLCRQGDDLAYAVLLAMRREHGQDSGTLIEIAVPDSEAGQQLAAQLLKTLEDAVNAARAYRGKVLSLEDDGDFRGRTKGITVHRLPAVAREEVVLPAATLRLLDRNVLTFVAHREGLRALGQPTRKGILLYGPPGTGKTHTIRYLASHLAGHTTLLITAEQIGLLSHYMALARLLQPSMVVMEDVDLIARARETMASACEESLLNKLLNEMDGLKGDADILFILTTNHPEQLEGALSGRPGRIDQAIEVPLPDAEGRAKLVRLYGRGLALDDAVVADAVARTEGVSAAFIKELMRRTAQAGLGRGGDGETGRVTGEDLTEALDDMVFTGGKLNVRLLGGAAVRRV